MDHFPDSFRKVATVVVYIIIAVSLIIVVIQTFCLMILQWDQEIVALGIPRSFLSLPLFIAAILMFFTTIHHLLAESTEHQRRE
ncbi:MAG: hypothetical protein DRP55_06950 [Spirochaetes bacterium]|nr:MAG: hypothetical protein DRP55_06950 [Spirochaetota bacterium]